jgi:hypothetical protein
VSAKYEFIDAEKADHAIIDMCAWLRVSRSGVPGVAGPAVVGDRRTP